MARDPVAAKAQPGIRAGPPVPLAEVDAARDPALRGRGRSAGRGRSSKTRIDAELAAFELTEVSSQRNETLSHGTRQRVALAQAFLHDPAVLVLDEPMVGLDPLAQRGPRRTPARPRGEGRGRPAHDPSARARRGDRDRRGPPRRGPARRARRAARSRDVLGPGGRAVGRLLRSRGRNAAAVNAVFRGTPPRAAAQALSRRATPAGASPPSRDSSRFSRSPASRRPVSKAPSGPRAPPSETFPRSGPRSSSNASSRVAFAAALALGFLGSLTTAISTLFLSEELGALCVLPFPHRRLVLRQASHTLALASAPALLLVDPRPSRRRERQQSSPSRLRGGSGAARGH